MVDIRDYGPVDPTGGRDSWAALQNAINAVATGVATGPIFVPAGTFKISGQITIPSAGGFQNPVRIVGTSADYAASAASILNMTYGLNRAIAHCSAALGSTTLTTTSSPGFSASDVNLLVNVPGAPGNAVIVTYNSSTSVTLSTKATVAVSDVQATLSAPKIVTYKQGMLALEYLALTDTSGGPAPFILTTGTMLRLSQLYFYGTGNPRVYDSHYGPGVTVSSGSASLTSSSSLFTPADVGAPVYVTSAYPNYTPLVPPNTYITGWTSATSCTMSQQASGSASGNSGSVAILSVFQDAIILGGTTSVQDNSANSAFSGYGTVIDRCTFNGIRRAAFYRNLCNAVTFRDNQIGFNCGGGANEAGLDVDGYAQSNLISGNDIELSYYVNGVRLNNANANTAIGNYISDGNPVINGGPFGPGSAGGVRSFYFTNLSFLNTVVGGLADAAITDDNPSPKNTLICPPNGAPILFAQPVKFGSAALVGFFGTSPVSKPTVTGSKGGNAALASLLTALAGLGLLTDNST